MTRAVRLTIAMAFSVVALWLAARNAHLDEVQSAVRRATFIWLLPYPILCVALNLLRGEIWRQLLERRVTSIQAFWAYTVGFLVNNVLPFRIGEGVRVVVLSARSEIPMVEVATAAGLERLLDMVVLSLMLVIVAPAVMHVPGLAGGGLMVMLVVAAAVGAIAVLAAFRDRSARFVASATAWLPVRARQAVVARSVEVVRALSVLFEPSIGLPMTAAAMLVWFLTVVSQWLVLRAFQPQANLTDAALMITAVSLAIALPAAPGFVGVYHWAGQQALVLAFPERYDASTALAAATVAHAVSYATSTAIGIIGLWYFGIPASSMSRTLDAIRYSGDAYSAPVR